MKSIKVLHIMPWVCLGGAARAMIATAKYSAQLGSFEHCVISLQTADPVTAEMAKEAGMLVLNPPDRAAILQEVENSDIVHVHYWNQPQMFEFLRSELPAMRLLMWFHVAGEYPPQVITKELVDYADFAIPCNPYSYELPVFQNLPTEVRLKKVGMVYDAADFARVSDLQPKPHDTFNVGYIGSVSFSKMHWNYVAMNAQIDIPNLRLIVCGGGIETYLQQQAQQLGVAERFDFRGFVEDIKSVIEIFDVYGYPLCEDTYAAAELNLQEVMYAGVPPVVFPHGGIKRLVINNYTGLIVSSELEYKQAIEYLYYHPEERARLGRNAKEYARQIFGAENAARQLNPIYERLMELPKREREWGIATDVSLLDQPVSLSDLTGEPEKPTGAELFIQSLGDTAPEFTVSFTSQNMQELVEAEQKIAASSLLLTRGEGGLSQYRDYYPNDGYLRLWSGLVWHRYGEQAEAISEFTAALNLGCNHWRVSWYLAQVGEHVNNIPLAQKALGTVLQAVPDFVEAREMLKRLESGSDPSSDLVHPRLRDINFIIFPDWSLSEDHLSQELSRVIKAIATHPDRSYITLLVDTTGISEEEANLLLSGVAMNLLMQEDLDVTEEAEISLVGQLGELQWKALLPRIHARIILEQENKQAIAHPRTQSLHSFELENLDRQTRQFFFDLSNQLFQEGRWQEAIAHYQKILEIQTGDAELYWCLSECFRQLNLYEQAFSTLQEGIRHHPLAGSLHFSLIINLQVKGRIQDAISSAITASNILPNDYTFKILKNLLLPIIYETPEEIGFYRQRFISGLQDLIQHTLLETPEDQENALAGIGRFTNFYLPHQAQNDRELQRQYGNLVHNIMAANYPKWVAPLSMPPLKENNKIRIGYVSAYLHSYSGTLWLTGWLRYCESPSKMLRERQNFEISCYYIGNEPDAVTQQFQEYSDVFHHIPHNLEAACEQIISDQLHILVFPEIGMNPQTMQMAALRLAAVQCVAWGHPVTSGLPTVDYFLSSHLMEPENAQEHYSETLIRLPNIGVSYPKPYVPPLTKTRADFQLRDDAVIYLCCQAPFKYLPQYDFIFTEIAHRVPQAQFIFLRGELLKPRLSRAFATVGLKSEDYCVFLTIPERVDYLMINLLSDVYLDTFSWSGGNTTLEAIACNLPIVTCPGEFMRGRHSYSFLKMIGVTDTIAQNEVEYIDIAVKLGLDPAWRRNIAERMSQSHDRLYDDTTCVADLETFYKQVVQENLWH
jgi:glycosyltransferase involved in cell wall biosynthesis